MLGAKCRSRGARACLLRLRDGISGAAVPARRALHADWRRNERDPEAHHRQGGFGIVSTQKRIKVVLAKPGLDGHDQGAKVVVRALMDAGMEVIYTGLRQTPEQVARIALDEDVDVIALSSMAGAHLAFCERLKPLLEQAGLRDKLWVIGGNLPKQD